MEKVLGCVRKSMLCLPTTLLLLTGLPCPWGNPKAVHVEKSFLPSTSQEEIGPLGWAGEKEEEAGLFQRPLLTGASTRFQLLDFCFDRKVVPQVERGSVHLTPLPFPSLSASSRWTESRAGDPEPWVLIWVRGPSVQLSCSVVSDSLWPHGLQHARPPCPSPTPGVYSNSYPSSRWCHPAISSSVIPSPPAPNPSQHQGLFQWQPQSPPR